MNQKQIVVWYFGDRHELETLRSLDRTILKPHVTVLYLLLMILEITFALLRVFVKGDAEENICS